MVRTKKYKYIQIFAASCALLSSCGGDGGSTPAPTPPPVAAPAFPTISQLNEITPLNGFSVVNERANISFTRLENDGTATVSLDRTLTFVRFLSPTYDTQFRDVDQVETTDQPGISLPVERILQQSDGTNLKRLIIYRPRVSSTSLNYLRAFQYSVLDPSGNLIERDVYNTTAGLHSTGSAVRTNQGASYRFVLRGLGRKGSLPTLVESPVDDKNVGIVKISPDGTGISFDIDVYGSLLNETIVYIGKLRGEGKFDANGSSFSGNITAPEALIDPAAGRFTGALYGPNADEIAIGMKVDGSTDIRLNFGLRLYGVRN